MSPPRNPRTRAEWQAAANAADFLLWLDAARQFGLITGGLEAHVNRCLWVLERAKEKGIQPQKETPHGS